MEVNFTKMVGSGNDFIVIDNRDKIVTGRESELAKKLCQRKFSVGGDGLLLVENSERANFRMRIFNPDGSEPEMCGNGARCIAYYASLNNISLSTMNFETIAGVVFAEVKNNSVKINMGEAKDIRLNLNLAFEDSRMIVNFINVGVPHAVVIEDTIENVPINEWGSFIRFHKEFYPQGTNVDFIEIQGKDKLRMRTYERGVEGETLACGTGAIASAVIAHIVKELISPVQVLTQGGETLTVSFEKKGESFEASLEGKVSLVYQGKLEL